ncbi:MAG: hypothetical protein ACPG6V_11785 [Flavobacteriales bacterium]
MKYICIFICILIIQCKSEPEFTMPQMVNSYSINPKHKDYDTIKYMNGNSPECIGVYENRKTIDLHFSWDVRYKETIPDSNHLNKIYPKEMATDSLEIVPYVDSLVWFLSKPGLPVYKCFPVLVKNNTKNNRLFKLKDRNAFGIQEVYDSLSHTWQPIEHKPWDFCGCCPYAWIIKPKTYMVLMLKHYSGPKKVKARLRLVNDGHEMYSSNYDLSIYPTQTSIDTSATYPISINAYDHETDDQFIRRIKYNLLNGDYDYSRLLNRK